MESLLGERGLLEKRELGKRNENFIVHRNLEKREGMLGKEDKGDLEEESEGSTSEFLQEIQIRRRNP